MKIHVAFYKDAFSPTAICRELEWSELVELLTTMKETPCNPCLKKKCPQKNGPAWSPAHLSEPERANENVLAVTAMVFDLDELSPKDSTQLGHLPTSEYEWVLHSTHSHGKLGCLRLVFPLSRPILPNEYKAVRQAAIEFLTLAGSKESGKPLVDAATGDLSRLFFLPSISASSDTEPTTIHHPGSPLPVDELWTHGVKSVESQAIVIVDNSETVDLGDIQSRLRKITKPEHKEIVQRVIKGQAIAALGEQDQTLQRICSILAFRLARWFSVDAMMAFLDPSLRATDWQDGYEHLVIETRKKLERAVSRWRVADAEYQKAQEEMRGAVNSLLFQPPTNPQIELQDDPEWKDGLIKSKSKQGDYFIQPNSRANLHLVLTCDPRWAGRIRFNELSQEIEFWETPVNRVDKVEPASTPIIHSISVWMEVSEYKLSPGTVLTWETVEAISKVNSYDPVKDWLRSLKWDGVDRLSTWLERYLRISVKSEDGKDIGLYVSEIGKRFLIAAVARALEPGCKADDVLMIGGNQEIFKSSFIEILSNGWFTSSPVDINNKDSRLLCAKNWFVELAELAAIRKSEIETVKQFFSQRFDDLRPAYGRTHIRIQRRCVFVGTTNAKEYLQDETGNRRFRTLTVTGLIDKDELAKVVPQLWAQATALFLDASLDAEGLRKNRWWLDPRSTRDMAIREMARVESEDRMIDDTMEDDAMDAFEKMGFPEEFKLNTMFEMMEIDPVKRDRRLQTRLGMCLHRLGFKKVKKERNGIRRPIYEVSSELLRKLKGEKPESRGQVIPIKKADS